MVNIHLYLIDTVDEARRAESLDLMDFDANDLACENCGVAVGFISRTFSPCVICVEGDDETWLVCAECAGGVLLTE
jgi:hypothetical protein